MRGWREPLALGLMIAGTIGGCVAPAEETEPQSLLPIPALEPPRFLDAIAMDQPTRGAEPNIAILPDGTIFITAVAGGQERPNALEGAAWLWRSTDGGATWETLREPFRATPLGTPTLPGTARPFSSSDADIVANRDGWVYYTDWWNWGAPVAGAPRAGNYLVERSGDGGETWESATITIPDPTAIDRQWLLAGENGFVAIFYAYFHPAENVAGIPFGTDIMSIKAVRSTDHGETWETGEPVTVVPPEQGVGYQIAHPSILADGTLLMPYGYVPFQEDFWTDPSEVRLAVSVDGGGTWEQRFVAPVPEGFDNLWAVQGAADATGLDPEARGHVYVAWTARTGETMTVFVSRSGDGGTTWTGPHPLRAEGLNFLPWVAARGDGTVAVGWYGGDATGEPLEAPEDAAWYPYVAESRDGGRSWAVVRVSEGPVKSGAFCPYGAACGSDRELLDYVSLEYDASGRLHYAFAKSREVAGAKAGLVHYAGQVAAP